MRVSFASIAALVPVTLAASVPEARGTIDPSVCGLLGWKNWGQWHYTTYDGCPDLITSCLDNFVADGTHNPWAIQSCVAASTCWGPLQLNEYLQCNDTSYEPLQAPGLDYNSIYAPIVGDCAYQDGGCPITTQNFVDFIYGSLSAIGSTGYPSSVDFLTQNYWSRITAWTATNDSVPYTNFNDWLFYSNA
ncbi:hypothetical protein CYLTODRAFT_456024 [Cylindrobasidium torrendii FP15055 ss-10]|uniref:Uncharacterized protein n=1 Tax=Cylindrobasidium torrendii FP15055 ss-10 TaxID=1314674 RepID=A0A0D7B8B8_9AGAR|nr:hypothetical protein CYLTODRAFT_456024 [Cylindrobasidium torrendii FP15055 ss-10]